MRPASWRQQKHSADRDDAYDPLSSSGANALVRASHPHGTDSTPSERTRHMPTPMGYWSAGQLRGSIRRDDHEPDTIR
jgi:hypothetical protein